MTIDLGTVPASVLSGSVLALAAGAWKLTRSVIRMELAIEHLQEQVKDLKTAIAGRK